MVRGASERIRFMDVVQRFRDLHVWQRGSERAPHKPLLALLALAELSRGHQALPFVECEPKLTELLREFGPTRKSHHAEYPFWRLQKDGIWEVRFSGELRTRVGHDDPSRTFLRGSGAVGEFPAEIRQALLGQPGAIAGAAREILADNFPETLHQDILDAIGLQLDVEGDPAAVARRRRDPNFRTAVLVAYGYRCATCGLDLRLGNITVGLEAAHVMWHQARGPDVVPNGLSLCSLHHKLFDFGAFTLDDDYRLLVSEHVNGSGALEEVLMRHHGRRITLPKRTEDAPRPEYLQWHQREVFKQRALPA